MLVRFSVSNYLSFKSSVTFDMSADSLKEEKNFVHVPFLHNPKMQLLKSAVIYGYNAFGKTNLIKAYRTYRNLILTSFNIGKNNVEVKVESFKLNTSMLTEPTFFESVFIIRNTKYRYAFEILGGRIVSEWLYYADGALRENALFIRHEQEITDVSKLWNKSSQNKVEQAKLFTKPNNLFLTVLLSQEGIPRVDEIAKWFNGNVILNADFQFMIDDAASIYTSEEYRSTILKFLDNADLGFTSIFEKISNKIQRGYHADMVDALYEMEKTNFDLYTRHRVFDGKHAFMKMIEFDLFKNESSGSIKYFIIACFLARAIQQGQLIWIDELDASLHTQLLVFLVGIFNNENNNETGAQLIFTTHNTVLLDDNLRRDQIWFVDKNQYGESSIHKGHSPEQPIRINKSVEKEYRQGRIKRGVSKKALIENLPSLFDELKSEKFAKAQKNFEELYLKVQKEIVDLGIAESLLDICTIELDRESLESQINISFLNVSIQNGMAVKTRFDKYAPEYGFIVAYMGFELG